jgi:hypothetical protein
VEREGREEGGKERRILRILGKVRKDEKNCLGALGDDMWGKWMLEVGESLETRRAKGILEKKRAKGRLEKKERKKV